MLTKERVKSLAEWLDGLADFKKIIGGLGGVAAELADGYVYKIILTPINSKLLSKVPEELHQLGNEVVDHLVLDDYEEAAEKLASFLSELINTPLGDEGEYDILIFAFKFLIGLMKKENVSAPKIRNLEYNVKRIEIAKIAS